MSNIKLKKWLIDLHEKKKKPLDFDEIVEESIFYFGKTPKLNEKVQLVEAYKALISENKLIFNNGVTYLPRKSI
ncbi:MAG: hypothetical protein QXD55_00655 [Candidatus Aenigmatarchaeota archaeon]